MRVVIKFTKGEPVKYISHLDILRLFQRAVMRAEVPILYSQGYNPHMLIGFACALPVGVTSQAEYAELGFPDGTDPQMIRDRLNAVLPGGVSVLQAWALPDAGATLAAVVCAARYEFAFTSVPAELAALPARVLEQKSILIEKKSKKGMKLTDIRPMVRDFAADENGLYCELAAGNLENLRPDVFWNYLKTMLPAQTEMPRICRTAQLILQNGAVCDAGEFRP